MQHTNRLIHETSPYLLQHAHNPVNWYPWGDEALTTAQKNDLPILVSIGYSACHWCHVMEKESFENEDTAALMNAYFINIKIDREERPDLDHIYMDAIQTLTGSGGWPLNVFLTPDAKPFFGGTYFPPERAYNRMSWSEVLIAVHKTFIEKREEVEEQAAQLTQHIQASDQFGITPQQTDLLPEMSATITENILRVADTKWGGFGKAPKFPQTMVIRHLLRNYHHTGNGQALQQALLSIDKMLQGGIYDQIGGGFARYSTDAEWLVPHFEKMLYDNALILEVLSEAYQITQNTTYRTAIAETINWLENHLMHPEGCFYSAWDADSEGVEGKYYVWKKWKIEQILGNDAPLFCAFYGITDTGNWEHSNILWIQEPAAFFAEKRGIQPEIFLQMLEGWKQLLRKERSKRVQPGLDNKILPGWNALMIHALGKAYTATGIEHFRNMAIQNMQFLEAKFYRNGSWYHSVSMHSVPIPVFLDDLAFLIQAYITLQEITGNADYLLKARQFTEAVMQDYSDEEDCYFYFTARQQKDILVRKKEIYDGATPSANAVMAYNLWYLSVIFYLPEWANRSRRMVEGLQKVMIDYSTSFGYWALVLQHHIFQNKEVVFTGSEAKNYIASFLKKYFPNKIFQVSENFKEGFPLLIGKEYNCKSMFYVCENYACQYPQANFVNFFSEFQLNH
ncbi:thioredoxin domain-containing protein [Hydrotalea sp.]|uniref:thioredoxin domain-containing protein n=2 Tax=Hydrotalea sp. TaxID=2881279 RepID=UPI00260741B7|nr:thioredoxin domain-containing protein [Hydrotalea sp.]